MFKKNDIAIYIPSQRIVKIYRDQRFADKVTVRSQEGSYHLLEVDPMSLRRVLDADLLRKVKEQERSRRS